MTAKILNGDNLPLGIYEGIISGYQLKINGFNEPALIDKEYISELDNGVRGMNIPVIIHVKNNEDQEKIIELTFKE